MNAQSLRGARLDRTLILQAATALGPVATGNRSAGQLIALLCDETTTSETLVSLIDQQPLLAARILRVANSAYYGYSRGVTTIPRAISLLGTEAVRAITLTCCFDRVMQRRLESTMQNSSTFLRHSIATAIAGQALATAARLPYQQEAYVAGILHNIGVAIQACLDTTGLRKLENARKSDPTSPVRLLERENCATTHEECGSLVLDAWQLPSMFVCAAAHHHEPAEAPPAARPLVALINIAATLATECNCGFVLEPSCISYDAQTLQFAQIDLGLIHEVGKTLPERVAALWETFALAHEPP